MLKANLSAAERRLQQAVAELEERVSRDTHPFQASTPADVQRRYAEGRADVGAFGRLYLPHYFESPDAAFHHDLDAIVASEARHIYVVHGPREHAKSTRVRAGLLRRLLYGTLHYPLLISEELYISKAHLDFLHVELSSNQRITSDFGVKILRYDQSEGVLRVRVTPKATKKSITFQIDAASYGTKVKGRLFYQHRPDFALLDDFEDTRSSRSERIGREKLDWVLKEVFPAVSKSAPVVWLGNVGCDTSALYQAMLNVFGEDADALRLFLQTGTEPGAMLAPNPVRAGNGQGNASETPSALDGDGEGASATKRSLTALSYRATTVVGGRTVYLWPERYEPAWYEDMEATMGPAKYESEMNGSPIREGAFFDESWFPTYDTLPDAASRLYLRLDPAFGHSESACFKALVVVATDGHAYYVVDAWLRQTEPTSAMLEATYVMFERYDAAGLRSGGYEKNFGQDDRLAEDFEDAAERHGYPLPIAGDDARGNKAERIESMQPLFSTGRVLWPAKMNPDVARLKAQCLAYPDGTYVDGPDVLESAITRLRLRGAGKKQVYQSLGKRRYTSRRP
ncbi:MAG: hypothetical protein IAE99_08265 [Rhodothermales bacterium]|nr:hypothetical protein [Rhodothermales bacterium]